MAPLSVLPGRVRFEAGILTGSEEGCDFVEGKMISLEGVIEASASHRTGRVLVRYDESLVTRSDIEGHMRSALQAVATPGEKEAMVKSHRRRTSSRGVSGTGSFLMEMALHALIPAPLDLLFPAAATVFRR